VKHVADRLNDNLRLIKLDEVSALAGKSKYFAVHIHGMPTLMSTLRPDGSVNEAASGRIYPAELGYRSCARTDSHQIRRRHSLTATCEPVQCALRAKRAADKPKAPRSP
jgi:hypothetical protein